MTGPLPNWETCSLCADDSSLPGSADLTVPSQNPRAIRHADSLEDGGKHVPLNLRSAWFPAWPYPPSAPVGIGQAVPHGSFPLHASVGALPVSRNTCTTVPAVNA